ncbi:bifunctional metallophosphatase/5'-nucleotidase [Metabacillus fastidiosus]|uniref:Bifunctional UDP-sugar hydrolase/5'-nucleotidase n=1 Tax=Metabacillus fastidiosus TaxID=1458 RepID=A0ABU6P0T5_9BACI|nr:bifunctional UDP-sugar hydrolase/5'-nucleotidase [Metabacillus fastidiosus]MED4402974.1 bifunctional UDP-sugar hydrolase/5'-nucleotidase [Metabacillus fastidiosus]MED4455204.1 bifunctional UDP-sugar hydrolase/5'-nucleotidase [Metabacillus fastidiosus]MED4461392.1 bifunctional UDP-sugar hydrolase/5'-nucleotidase [Metabacillus fastidiosus]
MLETIHIYHINDLHSHFANWPRIVSFVNKKRKEHIDNGEEMFLFDIGDHCDRIHPITEATNGQANIEMLNKLRFDAVTIGNNEGITFSHDALNHLYDNANFSVVLSNLYTECNERPNWVKPYDIIKLKSGCKIAILGVTAFYEEFYGLLQWKIKDPFQSLLETIAEVKEHVDFIILLSHLGINEDEMIAKEFPDIDIILGGHTHHALDNGLKINKTLLAGAGKFGQYVGHVELTIDTEKKALYQCKASLTEMETEEKCMEMEKWIIEKTIECENILSNPVGFLDEKLNMDWFNESPFSTFLVQSIKEWCDGDIAMVNAGMLLASLSEGIVTRKDLHQICPHPINPCKVYLKGDELKEIIIQSREERVEKLELKGLGFRGKIMGRMIYDGIEIESERFSDGKLHVTSVTCKGENLDPNKFYAVATVDMFTFGSLFPAIRNAEQKIYYMPELLRDLLAWKMQSKSIAK